MYNMEGHCKFYERGRVFKFQIFKGNYESKLEFPKERGVQTNIWSIDSSETFFQVQEEEMLVAELRKIEMRKKEREKKQQDLQKLITAAENQADSYRLK